jgi:uncharacterized OB-fold protein
MQGWICPGCGRCYAPSVTECRHCGVSDAAEKLWVEYFRLAWPSPSPSAVL